MGQRDGFSKGDITKINEMYKCPEKTQSITGANKPGYEVTEVTNVPDNENVNENNESNATNLLSAASNFLSALFVSWMLVCYY